MLVKNTRIALITGGESGIGIECCRQLLSLGYSLIVHYFLYSDRVKSLRKEFKNCHFIKADLSTKTGVEYLYDEVKKHGSLHVLVNNAGVTKYQNFLMSTVDDFDYVMSINLYSAWYLTRLCSRLMIKQKVGRIINVSSLLAKIGVSNQSIYSLTKATVDNFTRIAAVELAPYNILINSVAPGLIDTKMAALFSEKEKKTAINRIALRRSGKPVEVARVVRFLVDENTFCTGQVFEVDGGLF